MTKQDCDTACLKNPSDPAPEALIERLFERISEVSSLPAVAQQIIHLTEDPKADVEDLLKVIRSDPPLSMRLMRTANSSFYSPREKLRDLTQAIAFLGFRETRNLAVTAYVAPLFQRTGGHGEYTREGLWSHMVGTAVTARLIAKTCGAVKPQEAYLAGLLHDLGLILTDQYVHKRFCQVIEALTEETPVWEVERNTLGFDHMALGAYVASKWNLPDHTTEAIRSHHLPDQHEGRHREMVCVVALADLLCHRKRFPPLGVDTTQTPPPQVFIDLGLGKSQFAVIAADLDKALDAVDVLAILQPR